MQAPLQIAFHGLEGSDTIRELIEERVAWLERFSSRITSCRVVIEPLHRHQAASNPYRVRIDLAMPGNHLVINRESPEEGDSDLATVIRDAFDVARRGLEEHVRRRRGV